MSLSADQKLVQMETTLRKERDEILSKQRQLLNEFKIYALKKLKELGKPIKIQYRSNNGNEDVIYKNLKIGEEMNFGVVSFEYDPKTEIISEHSQRIIKGKKQTENFVENMNMAGNSFTSQKSEPYSLSKASDVDKKKVSEEIEKRINDILRAIFKWQLVFEDDEYKRLVVTNIALVKELERLNTRINALSLINGTNSIEEEKVKQL